MTFLYAYFFLKKEFALNWVFYFRSIQFLCLFSIVEKVMHIKGRQLKRTVIQINYVPSQNTGTSPKGKILLLMVRKTLFPYKVISLECVTA